MMNHQTHKNCLNVGVVGVGVMGERHCRVYGSLNHARLVGVCDNNREAGQRGAQKYNVSHFSDIDDLLPMVDAVSLATPTPSHFELAMRCLKQGVHVLIEKPITLTLAQAHTLLRAAEKNDVVVQVGHIERFNPTYIELDHVLADKQVAALNLRRLSSYAASNTDVNVIHDLMIHDIDLVLDLVGATPISVQASGLNVFSNTIDYATAQLCFANGPVVTLTASRITEQKVRTIEATTLHAFLEANLLSKSISVHRRTVSEFSSSQQKGVKYRQESIVEYIHVPAFEPLFLELEQFVASIRGGTPPRVSARDGVQALELAFAIEDVASRNLSRVENSLERIISMPAAA
jgi:predicted dehydrogenase